MVMSAFEVSGSGSFASTKGFSIVTPPVTVKNTSFQMPVSRPRTVGIQSQPTEAWKVGLSAPSAPPFLPGLWKVFCVIDPGVAFFRMRTARALLRPAGILPVTSKRARVKAPSMRPSFSPLR